MAEKEILLEVQNLQKADTTRFGETFLLKRLVCHAQCLGMMDVPDQYPYEVTGRQKTCIDKLY